MKTIYFITLVFAYSCTTTNTYAQTWWQQNSQTLSKLNEIFYVDDYTGWTFGDSIDALGGYASGIALKSITQGVPWFQQDLGSPIYQIEGSYFFNTNSGVIVGRNKLSGNGAILSTANGGATWTVAAPQLERMVDIFFANNNIGWTVGRNDFILRTNDGGGTWTDISASTGNHLNGVYFTTSNNGYVVGRTGNIIHSIDSGSTWASQSSGTLEDLNAVYFVNDSTGWAVGTAGTIIFTNDSGTTWNSQISGTSQDLMDVSFVNSSTGWAVGLLGTVLKTTDAGITWNPEVSGTTKDIFSITMRNSSLGWFCGATGIIYVYSVIQPNSIAETINDISVKVYPNPTNEQFKVELSSPEDFTILMYDIVGNLIYYNTIKNSNSITINKGDWKSGIYSVTLQMENGSEIHRKIVFE